MVEESKNNPKKSPNEELNELVQKCGDYPNKHPYGFQGDLKENIPSMEPDTPGAKFFSARFVYSKDDKKITTSMAIGGKISYLERIGLLSGLTHSLLNDQYATRKEVEEDE